MRIKKFSKFLDLLPELEGLKEIKDKTAAKVKANSDKLIAVRKKVKKWASWGFQMYLALFWIVQSIIDMGLFPF